MDLLDRLLGHDYATTRELLVRCEELPELDLYQEFDIGWRSAHRTFVHMISNVQIWTDLIAGRSVVTDTESWWDADLPRLQTLHESSYTGFLAVARAARDTDRMDVEFTDYLDQPPTRKTIGGGVLHVITHDMHHRSELIHILTRLGLTNPPEGDLMGWDMTGRKAVTT